MRGYLLCLTPLKSEHPKFPLCNVPGKTESKVPEMVVNSVCTTTLVHEKSVKSSALMGDKISVLTATGEHLIVPLAWIGIGSGQGKHAELVGVLDKLPVDCLLRRSSFGQTLSWENVLEQWERNVSGHNSDTNEAFALTRRQKMLRDAQERADTSIDQENTPALKNLSKKELKGNGLRQGDLRRLFEDKELVQEEIDKKGLNRDTKVAMHESELPINILVRNRNQLTEDQVSDVTQEEKRRKRFQSKLTLTLLVMEC